MMMSTLDGGVGGDDDITISNMMLSEELDTKDLSWTHDIKMAVAGSGHSDLLSSCGATDMHSSSSSPARTTVHQTAAPPTAVLLVLEEDVARPDSAVHTAPLNSLSRPPPDDDNIHDDDDGDDIMNRRRRLQHLRDGDNNSSVVTTTDNIIAHAVHPPALTGSVPYLHTLILAAVFCFAYLWVIGLHGRLGTKTVGIGGSLFFLYMMFVFFMDRLREVPTLFNVYYVAVYSTVISRLPLVLGPLLVEIIQSLTDTVWWNTVSLIVITHLFYFLYRYLCGWITERMSARFLYPRFLFVGQMFHYTFQNLMLGITNFGTRFLLLLLLGNLLTFAEHWEPTLRLRTRLRSLWYRILDAAGMQFSRVFSSVLSGNTTTITAAHDERNNNRRDSVATTTNTTTRVCTCHTDNDRFVQTFSIDDEQHQEHVRASSSAISTASTTTVEYNLPYTDQDKLSHEHHTQMLTLIFDIRYSSQNLLAYMLSLVITSLLVWFLLTFESRRIRTQLQISSQDPWLRCGLALLCSTITWIAVGRILRRRTELTQNSLKRWSMFGASCAFERNETPTESDRFLMRIGMDARLQRHLPTILATYLQNLCVPWVDVELFIRRFLCDLDLQNLDLSQEDVSSRYFKVSNLRDNSVYFVCQTMLVVFAVINSFDQRNQWCFLDMYATNPA